MSYELKIIEENSITPGIDQKIRDLLCICFPYNADIYSITRARNNVQPVFSVVYNNEASVLGHVGIVFREIICSGKPIAVAGIQNMAVHPDVNDGNIAISIIEKALNEAAARGIKFGFLLCSPHYNRAFYSKMGWITISAPITMQDDKANTVLVPYRNAGMYKSLADEAFPSGPTDIQGRDW